MEAKIMNLASEKWKEANDMKESREQDQRYHEVTILRELSYHVLQFGEAALTDFFNEITAKVQK